MNTMFSLDSSSELSARVSPLLTGDSLSLARERIQALAPQLQAQLRTAALHRGYSADSVASDRGFFLAQQLEQIKGSVKEEKLAKLNALDLFPLDTSVAPGAQTYKMRRKRGSAKMSFHGGGQGFAPSTPAVEQWEQSFPIHTAVTGVRYSTFDLLHADFAGVGLRAELMRLMTRGTDEFLNQHGWFGADAYGVNGVLNSPLCSRRFAATAYSALTGEQLLAEMQAQFDLFSLRDKGTGMRPSRCVVPPAIMVLLKRKLSSYHAQTVAEAFRQANPELPADCFVEAHELTAAGPSGQHVMFWYKAGSEESVAHVLPKSLTMLPAQADGFEILIPGFIRYGGVRMDEPMHNLLNYVPVA